MTTHDLATAADMMAFGEQFAQQLPGSCICYLQGELGAGKTTWMKGLLAGLGSQETLRSPTYPIVQVYHLVGKTLAHFDLYRINGDDDFLDSGLLDELEAADYVFIEWPSKVKKALPAADIELSFHIMPEYHSVTVADFNR